MVNKMPHAVPEDYGMGSENQPIGLVATDSGIPTDGGCFMVKLTHQAILWRKGAATVPTGNDNKAADTDAEWHGTWRWTEWMEWKNIWNGQWNGWNGGRQNGDEESNYAEYSSDSARDAPEEDEVLAPMQPTSVEGWSAVKGHGGENHVAIESLRPGTTTTAEDSEDDRLPGETR